MCKCRETARSALGGLANQLVQRSSHFGQTAGVTPDQRIEGETDLLAVVQDGYHALAAALRELSDLGESEVNPCYF